MVPATLTFAAVMKLGGTDRESMAPAVAEVLATPANCGVVVGDPVGVFGGAMKIAGGVVYPEPPPPRVMLIAVT